MLAEYLHRPDYVSRSETGTYARRIQHNWWMWYLSLDGVALESRSNALNLNAHNRAHVKHLVNDCLVIPNHLGRYRLDLERITDTLDHS